MNTFDALSKVQASGIALFIWIIALVGVGGAVFEARNMTHKNTEYAMAEAAQMPTIAINKKNLKKVDYEEIAEYLRPQHPDITFRVAGDGLRLSSKKIGSYYSWLIAMFDLMAHEPDVRWEVKQLCAGEGCSGENYLAHVIGIKKTPSIKR